MFDSNEIFTRPKRGRLLPSHWVKAPSHWVKAFTLESSEESPSDLRRLYDSYEFGDISKKEPSCVFCPKIFEEPSLDLHEILLVLNIDEKLSNPVETFGRNVC
jgi:hypothetical protein